ncbi:MAG: CMP-N,N-diacetyllegionaminic acid synthase [Patescibacteria group bacterium]|nr:CMP-N,N-diacetyllegionaminic acid synthase [Patescibacteria group bacterium]
MKTRKILAIIPARGGSKGIPRKNIFPLAGKPLLAWSVEAALKSKHIDKVVVSSDDGEILDVAEKFGAEPIKRPKSMAEDKSPFNLLIFHALDYLKKNKKYIPDTLVYLQPTSPLRTTEDIDQAFSLMNGDVTSVISVYKLDNKFLKSFLVGERGYLRGVANKQFSFKNRQELPEVYMPNGAIYMVRRDFFQRTGRLFSPKTVPFVMSQEKSVDIDTKEHMREVEKKLKMQKSRHHQAIMLCSNLS